MPRRRVIQVKGEPVVLTDDESETGSAGGNVRRGSRPMKEYYIYDSEFRELKRTGAIATILFAVGSACLGFVGNIVVGLALAETIPDALRNQWASYRNIGLVIAAICYLFAILAAISGYNRVEQIKAETSHAGERYVPRSGYSIALWLIVFFVILIVGACIGKFGL